MIWNRSQGFPRTPVSDHLHMCPEKGGLFICLQVCFSWLLKKKKKKRIKGSEGENTARGVADTEHHTGLDPQNKEQMKTLTLLLCLQFWQSRYSKNQCIFIGGFLWLPNYKNICVAF